MDARGGHRGRRGRFMKIFRIEHNGQVRSGQVIEGRGQLFEPETDELQALVDAELAESRLTEEFVDLSGPLLPPVAATCVRDFITFEQHTAGSLRSVSAAAQVPEIWYEIPGFYFTNPHALIGTGVQVPIPPGCEQFDFELEVGAVLVADGFNLSVEEAAECIGGLTILNDWSARDLQRHEMKLGLGPAKGKDTATTLGPWMVSVDELSSARKDNHWDLRMSVSVNGQQIGSDTLANMAWSFAELVAYASRGTWVRSGDIIGSGTAGGGCLAEFWGWRGELDPRPLVVGDEVEMMVEGLGMIRNTVVASPPVHPIPTARRRTVLPQ